MTQSLALERGVAVIGGVSQKTEGACTSSGLQWGREVSKFTVYPVRIDCKGLI